MSADLDRYVHSLDFMPTEIQTNLFKIREIDTKLQVLEKHTDRLIDEYFKNKFPSEAKKKERLRYIESLHAKANRYSENKVKISCETYELIDNNIKRLDLCMARFENEIEQNAAIIAMGPFHHYDADLLSTTSDKPKEQKETKRSNESGRANSKAKSAGSNSSDSSSTSSSNSCSSSSSDLSSDSSSSSTGTSSSSSSVTGCRSSISSSCSSSNTKSSANCLNNNSKSSTDSGRGSRQGATKKRGVKSQRDIKKRKKGTAGASSGEDRPGKAKQKKSASIELSQGGPMTDLLNVKSGLEDDIYHMPIDPHEPLYCVCRQVSYGEMIACDDPECFIEWFHFPCVGLKTAPRGEWYCEECLQNRNRMMTF